MIEVCVLTNLRRPALLLATLGNLARAGLPAVTLYCDNNPEPSPANHTRVYIDSLETLRRRCAAEGPSWALVCEDDIAVPVGLGEYLPRLCRQIEPHAGALGFATLFCSVGYRNWVAYHRVEAAPQFGRLIPNDCYAGTQCLLLPAASIDRLLPAMRSLHRSQPDWGGDRIIGEAACREGLEAWCHLPSLVDHRGRTDTTVQSVAENSAMIAADYVGNEWMTEDRRWPMGDRKWG